jgi:hypothetical protein
VACLLLLLLWLPTTLFAFFLSLFSDLDHTNKDLRDSLVDWLNWLHTDLGFEGWRFDFVRGFAGKYVKE